MSGSQEDMEKRIDAMFGTAAPDASSTETETNNENPTAGADTNDTRPDAGSTRPAQQNDDEGGAANSQPRTPDGRFAQQTPQTQPAQQPQRRNPGDLIGSDGNVIARAGAERRHYETAQRATQQLREAQGRTQQLETELNALRTANTVSQQLGLSPAEATTAAQFMAHWKRDPMGAAQNMLAELKAAGYNVNDLGPGVDVSAIQRMMDERLAPFNQDRQREEQQAQLRQQVEAEINAVYNDFTWAPRNEQALDRVMAANPSWSLHRAALEVERWATAHGLDLYQPLAEQLHARQQKSSTQQQLPNNARGPGGASAAPNAMPAGDMPVSAGRSNRDIVRETLRQHGIAVPE